MTVLQNWFNNTPMDPRNLKTWVGEVIRNISDDEPDSLPEPALMGRGLERC